MRFAQPSEAARIIDAVGGPDLDRHVQHVSLDEDEHDGQQRESAIVTRPADTEALMDALRW